MILRMRDTYSEMDHASWTGGMRTYSLKSPSHQRETYERGI